MARKGWSALRERAERGPSAQYLRLKDGEFARIRFLVRSEDDVLFYRQHWIDNKYRLCEDDSDGGDGNCRYCDLDNRPSENYAFNVIDRKDNKNKIFAISASHATGILEFLDEYGSINDRDYKVVRSGSMALTRYNFVPLKVAKWDAADIKLYKERYDLEEFYDASKRNPKPEEKATTKKKRVLDETEAVPARNATKEKAPTRKPAPVDEDEEEAEEEAPKKKTAVVASKKKAAPPPPEEDEEEELEEEDEEEEDEDLEEEDEEESEDDEEESEDDEEDDEEDEEDDEEDEDDDDFDLEDDE